MARCYHCKTHFSKDFSVGRSTICPSCRRDVRVCKNCEFYSPGSQWDCRESIGEPVLDKERGNFCDYFSLNPAEGESGSAGGQNQEEARMRFNALFNNDE